MSSKPYVTTIADQDWSKFDFSRWNLEGLPLDAQSATLAGWVRDVTTSPQWEQKSVAGLTAIKAAVVQDFKGQVKVMQKRASALDAEQKARVDAATKQAAALEESIRIAGAPPAAAHDAASYQIAAKVLDRKTRLGLPGLQVRIFEKESPETTLTSGTTDLNGNAVFKLTKEQANSLHKNKAEVAMEVLTPANKSVFTGAQFFAPKLNQVDTMVATLPASKDLAPHVSLASSAISQQRSLLAVMSTRIEAINAYSEQARTELDDRIQQLQQIIADLETPATSS
jgi:hypothetical protein